MSNLPTETGLYWARGRNYRWWNLIVRVYGDSPFLRIDVWDYSFHSLIKDIQVNEIQEFGPKIVGEAPNIEGPVTD